MPEQSLKEKTVNGVGWSIASAVLSYGVTFIVGLILARMLTPEEYGLIGIVTIFTTILLSVVDCGFSNSLIRKLNVNDDDYNTLFYFNFIVSLLMYLLLFIGAPWIASFFNDDQLISLVRITGLLIIISSFSIVQNTILTRRIDFKSKTKVSVTSAIISGVVGIIMAYLGFGVWALVAQILSQQVVYSISLWTINDWRPQKRFSFDSFKYMWNFGWKLLVSGLLDSIWKEVYQVIVGKFYNSATLGQYTRANEYAKLFSSNLTTIIQRVSYPVISQTQSDEERMISGYRRIIKVTMFVTAICMFFMGAVSEPLIFCLIGPQWHIAATYLPLICISLSLYPLHAINLNMLQVQGRTDIFLYLEIVKKIIAVVPICLGIFVDIYWMLIGSIFTGIIALFLNSYYTGKKLGYTTWLQIKDIAPSYGIATFIAISVYFFKYLKISYWIILPIQLLIGSSVFFIVCNVIKMPEYFEVKSILLEYWKKIYDKSHIVNR